MFPSLKALESSSLQSDEPKAPVFHSVEYKICTILEKINNIDNLDENEIKNIIVRQHSMILNYDLFLVSEESRRDMVSLFTNKRFLQIFLQVIGTLNLNRHEIVCINKLTYDYYITPNKDVEVSELLMQISNLINNNLVIRLSGIIGINGARILAMIANSSFKEEKNVHRTNTFLVRCELELSVQNIVDIYCILFETFTSLFTNSMLEPKPAGMNDHQFRMFDNISLALLAILDSMTSVDIKKVLYNYAFTLKLVRNNSSIRFRLKTARSYTRIIKIIEEIENEDIDELIIP